MGTEGIIDSQVRAIAKRWPSVRLEDLYQEAWVTATVARRTYDAKRGDWDRYLRRALRVSLFRAAVREDSVVTLPKSGEWRRWEEWMRGKHSTSAAVAYLAAGSASDPESTLIHYQEQQRAARILRELDPIVAEAIETDRSVASLSREYGGAAGTWRSRIDRSLRIARARMDRAPRGAAR